MPKLGEATLSRLIVLLVVLIAGCSSADGDSSPQPTPTDPVTPAPHTAAATEQEVEPSDPGEPTTEQDAGRTAPEERTTEQGQAEREVLAAYQGYWDAIDAANDPPDPFHPDLQRYATGAAYESVFEAAQTNQLAGRALRLPPDSVSEHRAEVVSIEGDTATVRDCVVDDGLVVDIESGEVLDDDVVTRLVTGTLWGVDGRWKVSHTLVEQTWEGVAGCALE